VYQSEAILRSFDVVRPRAAELLTLEYFEAEPARMPHEVFTQHHLVLNLRDTAMRVENWRHAVHRDFSYLPGEMVLTPAGIRNFWHWHERSKVIVVTIEPEKLGRFAASELGLVLSDRQLRDTPQSLDTDFCQPGTMLLLDALRTRQTRSATSRQALRPQLRARNPTPASCPGHRPTARHRAKPRRFPK